MKKMVMKAKKGAIMMEYALVCVLVAAACALGVWYFGTAVSDEFAVASLAAVGYETAAAGTLAAAQSAVAANATTAMTRNKEYIITKAAYESAILTAVTTD